MAAIPSLPDPEIIRRTAEDVLARPAYQLDPSRRHGETIFEFLFAVLRWIISPLLRLFDALEGMPDWLRWIIVVGLGVLLVALVVHLIYSLTATLRVPRRSSRLLSGSLRRTLDPAVLEREAEDAAIRDDFITAVRFLFRACLLRLARAEKRRFRPGLTNREHLTRYRDTSVFDCMELFVETIDTRWYGGSVCVLEDYEACRNAHARVQQFERIARSDSIAEEGTNVSDLTSVVALKHRRA
jgi:hypothetical protein